jgi:hypothetical protein
LPLSLNHLQQAKRGEHRPARFIPPPTPRTRCIGTDWSRISYPERSLSPRTTTRSGKEVRTGSMRDSVGRDGPGSAINV